MTEEPSAFTRKGGKWCPTITAPNGGVLEIGTYETRELAAEAYKRKAAELYPPPPPPKIDPEKHQTLTAAPFSGSQVFWKT